MQDDLLSNNNRAIQIGKELAELKIEKLEAQNARYKKALLAISVPDPVRYDGEMAFAYKMIAREALKGE